MSIWSWKKKAKLQVEEKNINTLNLAPYVSSLNEFMQIEGYEVNLMQNYGSNELAKLTEKDLLNASFLSIASRGNKPPAELFSLLDNDYFNEISPRLDDSFIWLQGKGLERFISKSRNDAALEILIASEVRLSGNMFPLAMRNLGISNYLLFLPKNDEPQPF